MLILLDKLIYFIVYTGVILGIWFLIYPTVNIFIRKRRISNRIRTVKKEEREVIRNKLIRHLEMILSVTLNIKSSYAITTFFILSGILFGLSFLFLAKSGNMILNLLLSLMIGLIPYLILNIKLHSIRVSSSYEAEFLVTELINQYKINYLNMIEAIDKTIPRLSRQPFSKRALFRLSLAVKQYRDKEDLEEIIQEFNFAVNTGWSILLANNLFLSIQYGDDVREALDDILQELIELKMINEKNKQFNHESFMMIKYVAPGTYLLSIYAMYSIFGFTTEKFLNYQLKNPLGFKFFLLTVGFIALNYIVYFFIKKPKNDF